LSAKGKTAAAPQDDGQVATLEFEIKQLQSQLDAAHATGSEQKKIAADIAGKDLRINVTELEAELKQTKSALADARGAEEKHRALEVKASSLEARLAEQAKVPPIISSNGDCAAESNHVRQQFDAEMARLRAAERESTNKSYALSLQVSDLEAQLLQHRIETRREDQKCKVEIEKAVAAELAAISKADDPSAASHPRVVQLEKEIVNLERIVNSTRLAEAAASNLSQSLEARAWELESQLERLGAGETDGSADKMWEEFYTSAVNLPSAAKLWCKDLPLHVRATSVYAYEGLVSAALELSRVAMEVSIDMFEAGKVIVINAPDTAAEAKVATIESLERNRIWMGELAVKTWSDLKVGYEQVRLASIDAAERFRIWFEKFYDEEYQRASVHARMLLANPNFRVAAVGIAIILMIGWLRLLRAFLASAQLRSLERARERGSLRPAHGSTGGSNGEASFGMSI
jgi:hypothetical protein